MVIASSSSGMSAACSVGGSGPTGGASALSKSSSQAERALWEGEDTASMAVITSPTADAASDIAAAGAGAFTLLPRALLDRAARIHHTRCASTEVLFCCTGD